MIESYESSLNRLVRSNESIQADIQAALLKEETIRSVDFESLSVAVQDGIVDLKGYVNKEFNRRLIEDIVRSVPGAVAVHNYIIADRTLNIEVAQALAKDERTRPYILRVGSFHGWVSLSGEVTTHQEQLAAEQVAGSVSSARGVVSLPRVTGEKPDLPRRAIQPRIGASVYGDNGQVGVATQVVINPHNKLVSHVVVSANYDLNGWPVFGEYILPVDAIALVSTSSVFLEREGLPLSSYRVFDPEEYPQPPITWQPPYPYTSGAVRWLIDELPEVAGRTNKQTDLNLEILLGRIRINIPLGEEAFC